MAKGIAPRSYKMVKFLQELMEQDRVWRKYYNPKDAKMRRFWTAEPFSAGWPGWDGWLAHARDIIPIVKPNQADSSIAEAKSGLYAIYQSALAAGFPLSSLVVEVKEREADNLVGADMDVQSIQAFEESFCKLTLVPTGDGRDYQFVASCCLVDPQTGEVRKFTRAVNIAPVLQWLWGQAAAKYGDTQVSGFGDHLASLAKSLASSKAVRQLAVDAAPLLLPGSVLTWEVAQAATGIGQQAKQGDAKAQAKVRAVAKLANQGDPKAQAAVAMMTSAKVPERRGWYERGVSVGHDPVEIVGNIVRDNRRRHKGYQPSRGGPRRPGGLSGRRRGEGVTGRWVKDAGGNWVYQQPKTATNQPQPTNPQPYPGQPYPGPQPGQDPYGQPYPGQPYGQDYQPYPGYPDPYGFGVGYPQQYGLDPYAYGQYGVNPFGQLPAGYSPLDFGFGFDPNDPTNIPSNAQVYDPDTDSFYSNEVQQKYDPETDTFTPIQYS